MTSIHDAQVKLMLIAALNGDITIKESAVNFRQIMFDSDLTADEKNAIFYMMAKGIEVARNVQLLIGDGKARDMIILALASLPLTAPKEIEGFLTRFLETLPRNIAAWLEWADQGAWRDIRNQVAVLNVHQQAYPTRQELGAKIEQFAAEGAISEAGLLRICKLTSALTLRGLDEQALVRALEIVYPNHSGAIEQIIDGMQDDPMLAVRGRDESN